MGAILGKSQKYFVQRQKELGNLNGYIEEVYSGHNVVKAFNKEKKEVEIDVVGTPVEGNEYIIGSCKYKNSPVGVDELELLKHYADVFGKGEKYHYYIFSKGGFTEGLQELADKSEVRLVTLQDMYK